MAVEYDLDYLLGNRVGPYNSFCDVSAVQVWQWCSAMGDGLPLYLDESYRAQTEFSGGGVVAPPAMMQMWTMRDFDMEYAPGSTDTHPYQIMVDLEALGFSENVAVAYDITFHRYLVEGDRAHQYKTIVSISDLKSTALGEGFFFTDRVEYLDQKGELFAEALITYFQYRVSDCGPSAQTDDEVNGRSPVGEISDWISDYSDVNGSSLVVGTELPTLTIPVTHKLIVGGAIASQDFIPVHHNVPAARDAGMRDIFMNILTTCGLAGRYLSDWAGPASRLRKLKLQLMGPNFPGDTLVFNGAIESLERRDDKTQAEVGFAGHNNRGLHVSGHACLALPN